MRYAVTFTNIDVLASVVGKRSTRRYLPPALFLLALSLLCVALARPHRSTLIPSDKATVILVVDVSGSMHATDVKPTRLGAAQNAVRTFLERVPKNVRVGLIAFSSEPEVAAPPTTDRDLVRASVERARLPPGLRRDRDRRRARRGSRPRQEGDPGRERPADDRVHASRRRTRSSRSSSSPTASRRAASLQPLEGAQRAKAAGIPVYTVALGTPEGVLTTPFGGFGGGRRGAFRCRPTRPRWARSPGSPAASSSTRARRTRSSRPTRSSAPSSAASRAARKSRTRSIFLAALALLAAGILSAVWAPRLP